VAAGATIVTEMTELAWGDRIGRIRDPRGNVWWIQAPGPGLSPDEMTARAGDPQFVEAMRRTQETLDSAMRKPAP
jgi:PhnB protein